MQSNVLGRSIKYIKLGRSCCNPRSWFIELVVVHSNGPRVNGRAPASRGSIRPRKFNRHWRSTAPRFAGSIRIEQFQSPRLSDTPPLRAIERATQFQPPQIIARPQTASFGAAAAGTPAPKDKVSGVLMDRGCHACCLPHSLRSGQRQIWFGKLTPHRTSLSASNHPVNSNDPCARL